MTDESYYQAILPYIDKAIMLCSCHNSQQDKELGKFRRWHTWRKGIWNGKRLRREHWFCNTCGRPYQSKPMEK